jgi:hypothetical protein
MQPSATGLKQISRRVIRAFRKLGYLEAGTPDVFQQGEELLPHVLLCFGRKLMVGVIGQHVPGATLQQGVIILDMNGSAVFDDLPF